MKTFILVIISIIYYQIASATPEIKKYYEIAHTATIFSVKGDFEKASESFEKAFTFIKVPFQIDINNAIYAETHRKNPDNRKINKYLKWIQNKGVCIHERYKQYSYMSNYIAALPHNDCNKVKNISLHNKIKLMIENDQKVRNLHPNIYHSSVMPIIKTQDSINYIEAEKILYSFLRNNIQVQEEIGEVCQGELYVILLHANPWGNYNKNLFDSMCIMGLMDNRVIADYSDGGCHGSYDNNTIKSDWRDKYNCQKFSNIYGTIMMFVNKIAVLVIPPQEEINRLNKVRESIYLQDIIDVRKFQIFAFLNNVNFSYPYINIVMGNKKTEDDFINAYSQYGKIKIYTKNDDFNFD